MKYQVILTYTQTDGTATEPRTCHPIYGDNLGVTIDRENGEWYYKRKLDGEIAFVDADYTWIMGQDFDGTFAIEIQYTNDGTTWLPYFDGTFSRANLTIDEDNQKATLTSLIEGVYNAIENGKDEDYDLMKLIPDGDAKEVQGQVHPALALIDYRSSSIVQSDIFSNTPFIGAGYKDDKNDFSESNKVVSDTGNLFMGIYAECQVVMKDNNSPLNGLYIGKINYDTKYPNEQLYPTLNFTSVQGDMNNNSDYHVYLTFGFLPDGMGYLLSRSAFIMNSNGQSTAWSVVDHGLNYYSSPSSFIFDETNNSSNPIKTITVYFHYIRATLLTQSGGNADNVLNTGAYYKRMAAFVNDGGLQVYVSSRTVEQPNGHRLIPGTGEQGTTPQYFAPPDDQHDYIPLAEANWTYGSLWYTITPSVANGLLDETKIGSFRWTRCWTIGTVLRYLLDRITDGKVVFTEDTTSSQFLYSTVNPVNQHEPFDYLITQKTNVMNPGHDNTHESAARCTVRLNWFLELLRNAFNCYYWLEKRNDGKYLFRVEHVEYFRRGGHYDGTLPAGIDITTLKPRRNFRDYANQLRKTYADQTNKYAYNMQNMVEKYTFSWQGDGGSDAFKGNPMFFKAGWIEKSSSEDHQVDNIFTDLAWLMLNSGTDTASSKNYDGVFLFSGYKKATIAGSWKEEKPPLAPTLLLSEGLHIVADFYIWITIPSNLSINLVRADNGTSQVIETYQGTGKPQCVRVLVDNLFISGTHSLALVFGPAPQFLAIKIHRIHTQDGQIYTVPNVHDLLDDSNLLQNGPLAWPWLQNEHLHYDIPANKWSYKHDTLKDANDNNDWESGGTVKMVQKQEVKVFPMHEKGTEDAIMSITGIHTSIEGGKTGIITNAKVNLSSRNAELTIVYNPVPQQ